MSNYEGVITPAYTVFRAKTPINNQYFKMLFKCDGFISKMNSLTVGIREGKNIMFSDFADSYIPFPPLNEQQRIADFLDRKCTQIDKTIEKEQQVIEKIKAYKQAIITEAVTKGLNPNVPMKESGIDFLGNIPKHWIVSRFSFETWVRARLGWKGLKAQEYVEDGYIFLSTPNIKEAEIDFINVNYINEERYQESPEIKLSVGDVLLAKDGSTLGTVNVVRYLPKEATVNSSIAIITPNNRLNGIYLMYLIKSDYIQTIIQTMKDGMGVPHLFQRDINKMHITVPPIEEQEQIALYLDRKCTKIDHFIKKKQMLIDKLSDYKKSLIYEAVTGKLEI
jgi:type I restriction enzyme S subunit